MTEPLSRGALTILVVEDEAVVRNVIMSCLVREDYRVLEADSAAEALEVSQTFSGTIDLLIADHTLKTMTGRQVAEHRARPEQEAEIVGIRPPGAGREQLGDRCRLLGECAVAATAPRSGATAAGWRSIRGPAR